MKFIQIFTDNIKRSTISDTGQGSGLCPFHEDSTPSFSFKADTGLWQCHGCKESGNAHQFAKKLGVDLPDESTSIPKEIASYTYKDENGIPLIQVRKYIPKTFRAFKFQQNQWVSGIGGIQRVLYRLPDIIGEQTIAITEGEKDSETLWGWNIPATTNIFGAGKWQESYSESLVGKDILIFYDNDEPGEKHRNLIIDSLQQKALSIKIIHLPNAHDVSSWKDNGGTKSDLIKIIEGTPLLDIKALEKNDEAIGLKLVTIRDLLNEPESNDEYLVEGLLSANGISLVAAKPKTGKSTLIRQLALAIATGSDFLGRQTKQGAVVYLSLEDRRQDVRRHFINMGATGDENIKIFAEMAPMDGINLLRKTAENEKPALIVIDTMARLARIRDLNDYSQSTSGLEPFLALSREVGCHVCLLHHAKKGDSKGLDSVLGSTGLTGSVDTIITLQRSEEYRTITSIQRDGNDISETVLHFDPETKITTLGESRDTTEINKIQKNILDYLANQCESIDERTISEHVEGNTGRKKQALRTLVTSGHIARSGEGKKGHPFLYSNRDSGFLVPSVSPEPENQNFFSTVTNRNPTVYSGPKESDKTLPIEPTTPHFLHDCEINYDQLEREAIKEFGGG